MAANITHTLWRRDPEMDRNDARIDVPRDPIGTSDRVISLGGLALFGLVGLMLVYAWFNRKYPPIRAKNLPLTTLMFFSGTLWFVGSFVCNGMLEIEGVLKHCKFIALWIRVFFGYMFCCTVVIRTYALDIIFIQGKTYKGWRFYLPLIVLLVGLVIFSVVSQLVPDRLTILYLDFFATCHYVYAYRYSCIALVFAMWVLEAVVVWRVRHIHSSFNEFRESLIMTILGLAFCTEMSVVHALYPYYAFQKVVRAVAVMFDLTTSFVSLMLILAFPVFQCMFRREAYLQEWLVTLSRDGLRKEYDIDETNVAAARSTNFDKVRMSTIPGTCTRLDSEFTAYEEMSHGAHSPTEPLPVFEITNQGFGLPHIYDTIDNGHGLNSANSPTNGDYLSYIRDIHSSRAIL